MQTFLDIANILLPLAYLLVAVDYGFLFFSSQPLAERTATPALRGTVLFHLAYLVALTVHWRQFPAATVSQALSIVAFAVAVVYVFVEWHGRARSTGFWLVSLVFFFQLLSSCSTRPNPPDRAIFHDPFFAAPRVARPARLRRLRGGRGLRLPLPPALPRPQGGALLHLLRQAAAAGGAGEDDDRRPLGGVRGADRGGGRPAPSGPSGSTTTRWLHDPKILFTLATWVLYAAALLLRRLRRWQGRQTALASLAGFGAILFSLVAVNFFFTDFHGFL